MVGRTLESASERGSNVDAGLPGLALQASLRQFQADLLSVARRTPAIAVNDLGGGSWMALQQNANLSLMALQQWQRRLEHEAKTKRKGGERDGRQPRLGGTAHHPWRTHACSRRHEVPAHLWRPPV